MDTDYLVLVVIFAAATLTVIVGFVAPYVRPLADISEYPLARPSSYWVHWRYSAEVWQQFSILEWNQAQRDARFILSLTLAGFMVLTPICTALGLVFQYSWFAASLIVGLPAMFGLLAATIAYRQGHELYQRRLKRVGETYIGKFGVFCSDGQYCEFTADKGAFNVNMTLSEAAVTVLQFENRFSAGAGRYRRSKGSFARVFVPAIEVGECKMLMDRISKYVVERRRQLADR